MAAKNEALWTAPSRKDTMLNGMLLGSVLIVVMYAAMAGTIDTSAPQPQSASVAAAVQPV